MPYATTLLAAALALLALVLLAVLLKSRRREGPMLSRGQSLLPIKGSLDADKRGRRVSIALGREILEMLEAGRRAEAVSLVRERTGWSATEADASITKLESLKKRLES